MRSSSLCILLLVVCASFIATVVAVPSDAVPIRDVTSIALKRGSYTTGRRSSPVKQLQCVGGTAKGMYEPDSVLCKNVGFDGRDVTWECQSDLPVDYRLGLTTVSCEGYAYPDDSNILRGSCGLEYTLELTELGKQHRQSSGYGASSSSSYSSYNYNSPSTEAAWSFGTVFVIIFLIIIGYLMCCGRSSNGEDGGYVRSEGEPPGAGVGGAGAGAGVGAGSWFRPRYGNSYNSGGTMPSSSSGPGFYSGMATGGLMGYLFGRNRGHNNANAYGHNNANAYGHNNANASGGGGYQAPSSRPQSSNSPSSSTHRSTSYAETKRR